jgi:hypothetical protein
MLGKHKQLFLMTEIKRQILFNLTIVVLYNTGGQRAGLM